MSREVCYVCKRAKVACLCGRIKPQANQLKVIVLQHPDEARHAKGSAIIAELGLQQYQCWVGEDFTQHAQLNALIENQADKIRVLYPAEQAVEWLPRNQSGNKLSVAYLIVIDATWRKARRIWESNGQLHALSCVKLSPKKASNYRIRKVPQVGYLSTVESIVEGLRQIEGQAQAYQPLLDLFDEMVDFQIESMGEMIYRENYPK